MNRMDYFIALYGNLPRAGPGDNASTRRAFDMIQHLPEAPRILDLGCGPGMQTVELLRLSQGTVVALDLLPHMISRVCGAAKKAGVADRLEMVQADMNDMVFEPESFDVIWSEGALYILGFRKGLAKIKDIVKPGGHVVISDAVWLEADAPQEAIDFWQEYPEIDIVERKLQVIESLGYKTVGHFVLPASSWRDLYYIPLEQQASHYDQEWKGVTEAEDVLAEARKEIAVFKKHSSYFSYAFFVMQK